MNAAALIIPLQNCSGIFHFLFFDKKSPAPCEGGSLVRELREFCLLQAKFT